MNKDVEQHLQELIDFYSKTEINDIDYLKKLFVRNLKDVQRRYIKYDKPRKEMLDKAREYINKITIELLEEVEKHKLTPFKETIIGKDLLAILGDKECIE